MLGDAAPGMKMPSLLHFPWKAEAQPLIGIMVMGMAGASRNQFSRHTDEEEKKNVTSAK